jgi:hypothetical protein
VLGQRGTGNRHETCNESSAGSCGVEEEEIGQCTSSGRLQDSERLHELQEGIDTGGLRSAARTTLAHCHQL